MVAAKSDDFSVRAMKYDDLEWALDAAAREGWNPGLNDADAFYAADPKGFFVGILNGRRICSLSAVRYGQHFGFMGLYIVDAEFRHQGYGWRIWQEGTKYLQGRCIGLDGVVEQQENYKKSGFQLSHRNIRFEGVAPTSPPVSVLPRITSAEVKKIMKADLKDFGAERDTLLQVWLSSPHHFGVYISNGSHISGYAVARQCRSGFKIGPLFAGTYAEAELLLMNLLTLIPGEKFYLDAPEVNKNACRLAETLDMRVVFETARMYTGQPPSIDMQRVFGVTTFELG